MGLVWGVARAFLSSFTLLRDDANDTNAYDKVIRQEIRFNVRFRMINVGLDMLKIYLRCGLVGLA